MNAINFLLLYFIQLGIILEIPVFCLGSSPMFGQKLIWGEGGTGNNNVLVYTFERNWLRGEMSISESRVNRHTLY